MNPAIEIMKLTDGVVHRALAYDPTSAREMHRTTLTGDERIN